jgi:hypothetical protein
MDALAENVQSLNDRLDAIIKLLAGILATGLGVSGYSIATRKKPK